MLYYCIGGIGDLQVGGGEVVAGDERRLFADDLVHTIVRVEVRLNVSEDGNRAVCASTSKLASPSNGGRDADSVVEGEAEGLVDLLTAFATVEEVGLDVLEDGEEGAAGRVCGDLAAGACHLAGGGTWWAKRAILAVVLDRLLMKGGKDLPLATWRAARTETKDARSLNAIA